MLFILYQANQITSNLMPLSLQKEYENVKAMQPPQRKLKVADILKSLLHNACNSSHTKWIFS